MRWIRPAPPAVRLADGSGGGAEATSGWDGGVSWATAELAVDGRPAGAAGAGALPPEDDPGAGVAPDAVAEGAGTGGGTSPL